MCGNTSKGKDPAHDINVEFIQSVVSADIFAMGIMLLQIATGCPCQLDLPLKVNCKTVTNNQFVATPFFGHLIENLIDEAHVKQTIKLQERLLANPKLYLTKSLDHYGLLADSDFSRLLTGLIAFNHYARLNV